MVVMEPDRYLRVGVVMLQFYFVLVVLLIDFTGQERWERQAIGTDASFRGICAVSSEVAWVSGTSGTVGRTINGGKTWEVLKVPGAEKLDFRDIEAYSADVATVLSIGPGEQSRIYKTIDGGKKWTLQFKNSDQDAFFDAIAFWDEQNGIAMSDPVKGHYRLITTENGGTTWKPVPLDKMPAALDKEGAFAASGTCLITTGKKDAWLVTGGAKVARVFHSKDRGQSWEVVETPILAGRESAGIFSIAFKDENIGLIVGGDYQKPQDIDRTIAMTEDGGKSWRMVETKLPFCSCVVWAKDRWLAVGTAGAWASSDGKQWNKMDKGNYNCLSVTKDGTGWAAGPKSLVIRVIR